MIHSGDARLLRWAFLAWHGNACELATEENKVGKMLISWSRHCEHSAFQAWVNNALDQRDRRVCLQAMMGASQTAVANMAFREWEETARERRALTRKMTRIILTSSVRCARFALRSWLSLYLLSAERTQKCQFHVKKGQFRALDSAYISWAFQVFFICLSAVFMLSVRGDFREFCGSIPYFGQTGKQRRLARKVYRIMDHRLTRSLGWSFRSWEQHAHVSHQRLCSCYQKLQHLLAT